MHSPRTKQWSFVGVRCTVGFRNCNSWFVVGVKLLGDHYTKHKVISSDQCINCYSEFDLSFTNASKPLLPLWWKIFQVVLLNSIVYSKKKLIMIINTLKTNLAQIIFMISVQTSKKTQCISITNRKFLTLFKETKSMFTVRIVKKKKSGTINAE